MGKSYPEIAAATSMPPRWKKMAGPEALSTGPDSRPTWGFLGALWLPFCVLRTGRVLEADWDKRQNSPDGVPLTLEALVV